MRRPNPLDDFDARRERMRRDMARARRITFGVMFLIAIGIALGGWWLLGHPEEIGAWFGRFAAGVESGAS